MSLYLPRLPENFIEQPTLVRRYWDDAMKQIEGTLNSILSIPIIEAALATINAAVTTAQTAANTAQTAANTAQTNVTAAKTEASIVNSYPSGFTPPLVSANAAGVVTIVAHTRTYGDSVLNPSVVVTGGTLTTTGASADVIRVYYDDPSRAGGAVTYQYTKDPAAPPVQSGSRHVVGAVAIPAAGSQSGRPVVPPGYVSLS